jgi:hypothetical protein
MILRMIQYFYQFRVLIVLGLLCVLVSCAKTSTVRWVVYDETYCSDKWDYNSNNEKLKENVVAFLKNKGIKVLELEIYSDRTPEQCANCTCKSGRRIKCKIKKRDVSDANSLDFYVE